MGNEGMKKILGLMLMVFLTGAAVASSDAVSRLISQGDRLDEANRNAEALPLYLEADQLKPGDPEILRRIAKQYSQMVGDTTDRREKKRLAQLGLDYAIKSVETGPNNAQARLSLAICYGRVAFFESPGRKIEYSKRLKEEAEAAVKLDPSLDYAWHVLGRWNYEMANLNPAVRAIAQAIYGRLPDASNARAVEYFQKAIANGPPRVVHHVELGRAYLAVGDKERAAEQLRKGLALPSKEKDDEVNKARGREALQSI